MEETNYMVYLKKKKIDSEAFERELPILFAQLRKEYAAAGENNLELRKKFFWNDLRISFPIVVQN